MSSVVANKRTSESKFVSVFADSRPDVDITFKDALLSRPSNHFVVGVDNFGISLGSLPMCDPADQVAGFYIIRLGRQRRPTAAATYFSAALQADSAAAAAAVAAAPGDGGLVAAAAAAAQAAADNVTASTVAPNSVFPPNEAEFVDLRIPFQNVQQFLRSLQEWAAYISTLLMADIPFGDQIGHHYVGYTKKDEDDDDEFRHFSVRLGTDGRLRLIGSKAFWANFFISIQKPKYQYALEGKKTSDNKPMYIALDGVGKPYNPFGHITTNAEDVPLSYHFLDPAAVPNGTGFDAGGPGGAGIVAIRVGDTAPLQAYRGEKHQFVMGGNIWSSLDRRVALEMGCSLPIENSPMVDHNNEFPDFSIGRWLYNPRARAGISGAGLAEHSEINAPGVVEYQNATDRVVYHQLRPQDKVQTLRLKLFARVRTYNESKDTYSMETIEVPTNKTDWWHARLHFVSKD